MDCNAVGAREAWGGRARIKRVSVTWKAIGDEQRYSMQNLELQLRTTEHSAIVKTIDDEEGASREDESATAAVEYKKDKMKKWFGIRGRSAVVVYCLGALDTSASPPQPAFGELQ
ncbi:hypothetical protein MMC26_004832 [Xylographa opegraphella]|nr:hypothetical protein [Xylographa opegraphella]